MPNGRMDGTGSAEILLAFGGGHGVTRPTLGLCGVSVLENLGWCIGNRAVRKAAQGAALHDASRGRMPSGRMDGTGSAEILLAFGGGHGVTRPTLGLCGVSVLENLGWCIGNRTGRKAGASSAHSIRFARSNAKWQKDATGSAEILLAFGGGHRVTRPTPGRKRQTGFLETRTFFGVG